MTLFSKGTSETSVIHSHSPSPHPALRKLHSQDPLGWDLLPEGKQASHAKPASYTKEGWNLFPFLTGPLGRGRLRGLAAWGFHAPDAL